MTWFTVVKYSVATQSLSRHFQHALCWKIVHWECYSTHVLFAFLFFTLVNRTDGKDQVERVNLQVPQNQLLPLFYYIIAMRIVRKLCLNVMKLITNKHPKYRLNCIYAKYVILILRLKHDFEMHTNNNDFVLVRWTRKDKSHNAFK